MQLLSRSYSNVTHQDYKYRSSFGSVRQVPQYRNKNENNTRPLHSFLHTSQQRRMCLQHGKNNNINKIHEFSAPLQVRNSRAPSRLIVDWVFRGNSRRECEGEGGKTRGRDELRGGEGLASRARRFLLRCGDARNTVSRSKSATICKRRRHESQGLVNILCRGTNDYLQAGSPRQAIIVG